MGQYSESNNTMANGLPNFVHVETGELIDYFASRVSSKREREIEEHIAGCGTCAESSREIYSLVFGVQRLAAKDLGQAFARQAVVRTLARAANLESNAGVKRTYSKWVQNIARGSAGVIRTIVRSSGAEFLIEGLHAIGDWKISPAHAMRGLGSGDQLKERKITLQVPGEYMRTTASLQLKGDQVSIEVAGWPGGCLPVAILVDTSQSDLSACGQTTQVAEGQYEILFPEVTPGSYLMLLQSVKERESNP